MGLIRIQVDANGAGRLGRGPLFGRVRRRVPKLQRNCAVATPAAALASSASGPCTMRPCIRARTYSVRLAFGLAIRSAPGARHPARSRGSSASLFGREQSTQPLEAGAFQVGRAGLDPVQFGAGFVGQASAAMPSSAMRWRSFDWRSRSSFRRFCAGVIVTDPCAADGMVGHSVRIGSRRRSVNPLSSFP